MRTAGVTVAASLLLTGCSADPVDELQALVAGITVEANERDADGVRRGVQDLLSRLEAAVQSGDLTAGEAEVLRDRALAVEAAADEIDPDVIARREAEQAAAEAQAQLEAERAVAEAERKRLEEERRKAEEAAKDDEGKGDGEGKDEGGKDEGGD